MSWRDGDPNDLLYSVRSRGLNPYPTEEERDAWEQRNGLDYYQGKPLSNLDRNWRSEEERNALKYRTFEVKHVGNPRRPERSLVPLPPPTETFEELMEDKIAPSVIMLALKINGVLADDRSRDAILEWVNARLKIALHI